MLESSGPSDASSHDKIFTYSAISRKAACSMVGCTCLFLLHYDPLHHLSYRQDDYTSRCVSSSSSVNLCNNSIVQVDFYGFFFGMENFIHTKKKLFKKEKVGK